MQTVTADGRLLEQEVLQLRNWLETHRGNSTPAVAYLREAVEEVLADGRVTDEERAWLQKAIETVLPREERERAAMRRREAAADDRLKLAANRQAEKERMAEKKRRSRPIASFDFMVAGVHHEGRRAVVRRFVRDDCRVYLARDLENPHSSNAIAIRLKSGFEIGYVPESQAARLAPFLDDGAHHIARVKKVLQGRSVPIPVVWGDLLSADAPVRGSVGPSETPQRREWSEQPGTAGETRSSKKSTRTGCLVVVGLLLGALALASETEPVKLTDEVALQYYRLERIHSGAINVAEGDTATVHGPTEVGTGKAADERAPLSEIIEIFNARFGTSFTEEDRLFFQQIKEKACRDEQIVQIAQANPYDRFALGIRHLIERLMIQRMSDNDAIVTRYMEDREFQGAAFSVLAREIFEEVAATGCDDE